MKQATKIASESMNKTYGCFQNYGYPEMDGLMENPIKMDDLEVPLFSETSISYRYKKYSVQMDFFFHVVGSPTWKSGDVFLLNSTYLKNICTKRWKYPIKCFISPCSLQKTFAAIG